MSSASLVSSDLFTEQVTREFQKELEEGVLTSVLRVFNLKQDLKVTLIKLGNSKKENLLHRIAYQIIQFQESQKDEVERVQFLKEKTFEILDTTGLNGNDLKELVTSQDDDGLSFLFLAHIINHKFADGIIKRIPEEDKDVCYKHLEFKIAIDNNDLLNCLKLFFLSDNTQKTSFAKTQDSIKKNTLIQMLIMQNYKTNGRRSELLTQLIKILLQINPNDRKDIVNLQNSFGRNVFHLLAALCKDKDFKLLLELLEFIPEKDRAKCLKTTDSFGWTPLHQIAYVSTHEDDLNEKSIKEILNLLPSKKDKEAVTAIKDRLGRTYKEIQRLKKEIDEKKKAHQIEKEPKQLSREVLVQSMSDD